MDEAKRVYGIDLGTTYSCIATIDEYDNAVVIKNDIDENVTPSVVYYETADKVIVGETAKDEVDPTRRVAFIKREIGNDNFVSKCIVPEDPTVVSAYILRKLVNDANARLGANIQDVVITCPAYFGTKEKMQTQQAGEIAGLNVLSIIQEPTAAAISYGLNIKDNKSILVYDLGGGTFDVTIIDVSNSAIRTIATGGDSRLGGVDWDKEIVKYLANQYENETGESDILQNPDTEVRLYSIAERAKKNLTQSELFKATVVHEGIAAKIELSRETFESITANHLLRTISILQDVLNAAIDKKDADGNNVFKGTIDEVLLVGGSCRMPQVRDAVNKALSCDAKMFDPDQAVAKGATMFAKFRKDYEVSQGANRVAPKTNNRGGLVAGDIDNTISDTKIINVLSRSYGIGSVKSCDHSVEIISTMIFEQDELPISVSKTFTTISEGQRRMKIDVYECSATRNDTFEDIKDGEHLTKRGIPIEEGELLDKSNIEFGKPMKVGTPVLVTFNVDSQGMLYVTASEKQTGKSIEFSIHLKGVRSKEEIKIAAAKVSRMRIEG